MESIHTELAHYGSKNECARTDTDFLPISEICDGTVSLFRIFKMYSISMDILGILVQWWPYLNIIVTPHQPLYSLDEPE